MGEIFHALEVLNRSMKLGLNADQLLRAEMGFKSALAMQGNPDPSAAKLAGDPVALAEQFELVATLKPRSAKLSLSQLASFAGDAVKTPRTRVDAATFTKIDRAIAASKVSTNTGTKLNPTKLNPAKTGPVLARAAKAKTPKEE